MTTDTDTSRACGQPPRPDPHPPTSRRWMWFAAWPVVVALALSNEPAPLYVVWQDRLGFSAATLTLIYAFYVVGLLGTLIGAGSLADRIGRRPVLLPGLALGIVAAALFATADSVPALALARTLSGVTVGAFLSAGLAAVSDLAPAGSKRLGGLVASASMVGGAALGPMLSGILSETLPGPTVGVFVLQIALLVTAFPVVLRMPLHRPAAHVAGTGRPRIPSAPRPHRRGLLLGLGVFAPAITATGFVLSLGPSLLADLLHTSNRTVAGGTIFILFAAATGVQFAARGLTVPTLFRLGATLTVSGMTTLILAVPTGSVTLVLVAAVLAGLGQGSAQLGALGTLSSRIPSARLAEANAALTAGGYLMAGALPVGAGYLSDAVGLAAGTTAFGVTVAILVTAGAVAATTGSRATAS
ncbi:putative MFS family arabinose efflux permease [Haloactinopolyspora alba]|uniref:Putative MFS family arabinose efflux permease n=1 Tax=Haloactinopolyspora alba TaxID=648780 RepID=A0A2P8DXA9_9ACTN|nr:MFS transporter [Haloactinopolyspora alba]PSL01807.1 putative MFS family arabinose efflux permease [Haloactinopolyspora alba]